MVMLHTLPRECRPSRGRLGYPLDLYRSHSSERLGIHAKSRLHDVFISTNILQRRLYVVAWS